jgi:hypothetical protein
VATRAAGLTEAFYRGDGGAAPASARPSSGPGNPPTLGVTLGPQVLDEAPQLVETPTSEAGHPRAVQPVQKLPATSAAHQKGDKVSRLPMVQDLHHARFLRKARTGVEVLK